MQAWYYDEILYRVITEETHLLEYTWWNHRLRTAMYDNAPEFYTKRFKEGHYAGCIFDPTSADRWTDEGRETRQCREQCIADCKSLLGDSRHPIRPAALVKSGIADLKEEEEGRENLRYLGEGFDLEPQVPTVDSMDWLDELVVRSLLSLAPAEDETP